MPYCSKCYKINNQLIRIQHGNVKSYMASENYRLKPIWDTSERILISSTKKPVTIQGEVFCETLPFWNKKLFEMFLKACIIFVQKIDQSNRFYHIYHIVENCTAVIEKNPVCSFIKNLFSYKIKKKQFCFDQTIYLGWFRTEK